MAMLVKNVVMGSVILLMLGVGMRTSLAEMVTVLKRPRAVLLGLVSNFAVVPLLTCLVLWLLPLPAEVKIGIMLMAAAPVAPMAPPFAGAAKGDLPYSVGLMAVAGLLSIPLTPLILGLALPTGEGEVGVDTMEIVRTLLVVQLIPISLGIAVRSLKPGWGERLLKVVPKLGQFGLLAGVGLLLAKQAGQILTLGIVSYVTLVGLAILYLAVGHWTPTGGPPDQRRALAVSTAIRNIPLAFLIATGSFAGTVVGPVTLIFSVLTMVGSVVYGRLVTGRETRA